MEGWPQDPLLEGFIALRTSHLIGHENLYTHSGNKHWENVGELSKVPSLGFLIWKMKLCSRCQALAGIQSPCHLA